MSKKRKSVLFRFAILSFAVYLTVMFVNMQIDIRNKKQQLTDLNNKVEYQTEKNGEMERLLSDGGEKEYIERLAREKLGYAYPNERIFIDISGN